MKFLISLLTVIVCLGIFVFGALSTIAGIEVDAMMDEIKSAFSEGPLFPELPEDNRPEDNYQPGDGSQLPGGDNNQQPGDGGTDLPDDDHDQKPGGDNNEQPSGGNNQQPDGDDADQPEDDNNQQPSGGNQQPGGDNNQQPSGGDNNQQPGGDNDQPGAEEEPPAEEPAPPTLSTEEAKESFRDLYENHDPDFADIKKDMLTNMITGLLSGTTGGGNDTPAEPEDPAEPEEPGDDFEENFGADMDFGTEFDPDAFEPEEEPEEDETEGETVDLDTIITEVMNSYVDNLFTAIEEKKEAAENATEQEKEVIKEEFVQKEAEAVAGLVNIAGNAGSDSAVADDLVKESVDAILGSDVCMNTVTQVVESNEVFTEKIQEATSGLAEETKTEIQSKIESTLEEFRASENYSEEAEQKYRDLANLFGITLGNGTIPNIPGFH